MKNVTSTCVFGCESPVRPGHRRRVSRKVSKVNGIIVDPETMTRRGWTGRGGAGLGGASRESPFH